MLRYGVFALAILGAGAVVDNNYYLQLMNIIGIYTLLAVGLNMLMGYAGQISLGHAAFFGLGAYTTGILTVQEGMIGVHFGWSPWAALPVAMAVAGVVAWLVGRPTLKLTGYYLGMGTLGFGMIFHILFREMRTYTGGSSGMVGIPPLTLGGLDLLTGKTGVLVVWGTVFLAFFICERIVNSRVGRALIAIHKSQQAAAAVGVDTARAKLQVFVFSAVLASIAGFLYAHMLSFISPSSFNFLVSVKLVAMVVIGGMASIWGALLGASVLTLLPEFLHVFADYEIVVYGLVLIVVMVFLPEGLTRGILDAYERARHTTGSRAGTRA